jgi:hypothetical protein
MKTDHEVAAHEEESIGLLVVMRGAVMENKHCLILWVLHYLIEFVAIPMDLS